MHEFQRNLVDAFQWNFFQQSLDHQQKADEAKIVIVWHYLSDVIFHFPKETHTSRMSSVTSPRTNVRSSRINPLWWSFHSVTAHNSTVVLIRKCTTVFVMHIRTQKPLLFYTVPCVSVCFECSPLCVKRVCLERCILYERENEVESLSIVCTMRTAVPIEAQTNKKNPGHAQLRSRHVGRTWEQNPRRNKKWKAVHQRLTQTAVYVRFDFSFRRIPLVSLTTADRHRTRHR